MADPFEGPRAKLDRANEHIAQLDSAWKTFFGEGDPHEVWTEHDSQTGEDIFRVKIHKEPPLRWSTIAGDTIHNLRASLDLLFWQLVEAAGKTSGDKDAFPISDSQSQFEQGAVRKVKRRVATDALRVLCELKPYRGGNDALWALHKLDIIDKHRLLLVVGSAHWGIILGGTVRKGTKTFPIPETAFRFIGQKCPLKDGDEITRHRQVGSASEGDIELQPEFKIATTIALCEADVTEGEPLIPLLNDLSRLTEQIIDLFQPLVRP